jgi:peroxiredoxin
MSATAAVQKPAYRSLQAGDPAPWFRQACTSNPDYVFDTAAGRYIVLCFYGTASDEAGRSALAAIEGEPRSLFDDDKIAFFGVSFDPGDREEGRVSESLPGIRHFWDFDGRIGQLYGALPQGAEAGSVPVRRFWIVLNPTLRVRAVFPFREDGSDRDEVMAYLRDLPPVGRFAGFEIQAPVLVIPDVFEEGFCKHLIGLYEADGGTESGFMREVDGKTVAVHNPNHKRRKDYTIADPNLVRQVQMERYIVSCYAAQDGGHFRAHRDNTTRGTAHRRFAVSINLNADFEGGEVGFPEYGPRTYKAPAGGAVVFSCSLLHSVSKMTQGRRFAFLPFIYDDEAARIREANNAYLGEGVGAYKA